MNWKLTRITYALGILLYALSFFGFIYTDFAPFVFVTLCLWFGALTLWQFKYGLSVAVTELVLGSHGHVFDLPVGGQVLSLRIAFFLILCLGWGLHLIRSRKLPMLFKSTYLKWFILIAAAWSIGIILAMINGYPLGNVFADANGFLFFFYAFFVYDAIANKKDLLELFSVIIGSLSAMISLTFFLLYLFSHETYLPYLFPIYRWIRVTGIGEITQVFEGFHRIFFAGHLYVVLGLIIAMTFFSMKYMKAKEPVKKEHIYHLLGISLLFSIFLVSMSRSFWLATFSSAFLIVVSLAWRTGSYLRLVRDAIVYALALWTMGLFFITVVLYIPIPPQGNALSANSIFFSRATDINGEAAISSRWNLLDSLVPVIQKNPIVGYGFGKEVTYQSDDPRIIELTGDGVLQTFAFEWGYLDIWVKMGLFGVFVFVGYVIKLIVDAAKRSVARSGDEQAVFAGIAVALCALAVIHIFTPYINHPLGIFFLVLSGFLIEQNKNYYV